MPRFEGDEAIQIRDVLIPPLRRRPSIKLRRHSSQQQLGMLKPTLDDCGIAYVLKKKKSGLFDWLKCGKKKQDVIYLEPLETPQEDIIIRRRPSNVSIRIDIAPPACDGLDVLFCIKCQTQHYSTCFLDFDLDCCVCTGRETRLCEYQRHYRHTHHRRRRRHRHRNGYCEHDDDYYDSDCSISERSGLLCGTRTLNTPYCPTSRFPPPITDNIRYGAREPTYGEWLMRRRGKRYRKSTECKWREELIDLMAEQREENVWERQKMEMMPEYEKSGFAYRVTQERKERMEYLKGLLEEVRRAEVQGDRVQGRIYDPETGELA